MSVVDIEIISDTEWMKYGHCNGVAPGHMYPDDSTRVGHDNGNRFLNAVEERRAKEVCWASEDPSAGPCPVMQQCFNYAQETRSYWGVWGGMGSARRQETRKKVWLSDLSQK